MALTYKQRAFIENYLTAWNATEAARLAGYSGNDATLAVIGSENIRKPKIRTEIDQRLQAMGMGSDEVLARLSQHASASMEDFIDYSWGVPRIDLQKAANAGKLHLLKKVSYDKDGRLSSIELHDSQSALVQLGRYHKLFTDRLEVDWRLEMKKAGIDATDIFERMVDEFSQRLSAGVAGYDARGLGDGSESD
jgi:hypothetical protein